MRASASHPSLTPPDSHACQQIAGPTLRYVSHQSPAGRHRHDQLDFKKEVAASLLGAHVSAEPQVENSALAPLEEPPERRVLELARAVVQEDPDLGALAMREATSAEESASWHRKPKTGAAAHTKGSSVKKGLSVLPAPTAAHRALYMALGGEAVGEAHVSLSTSGGVARCMRELAAAVAMVGCVPPPGPMPMPLLELVGCAQREEAEASAAQSEAARSEQLKPPATQPSKKAKRGARRAAERAAADAEDKLLEAAIDESVRKRAALEARRAVVEAHQPSPKWEASDAPSAARTGGGWQVFVMHPTSGKSTLVPVAGGETTVKEVAEAFAQKTSLPAASLRLQLCKGPSLECTATLRAAGLANGGTVHALFVLLGGMHQEEVERAPAEPALPSKRRIAEKHLERHLSTKPTISERVEELLKESIKKDQISVHSHFKEWNIKEWLPDLHRELSHELEVDKDATATFLLREAQKGTAWTNKEKLYAGNEREQLARKQELLSRIVTYIVTCERLARVFAELHIKHGATHQIRRTRARTPTELLAWALTKLATEVNCTTTYLGQFLAGTQEFKAAVDRSRDPDSSSSVERDSPEARIADAAVSIAGKDRVTGYKAKSKRFAADPVSNGNMDRRGNEGEVGVERLLQVQHRH